eukprot:13711653-Alexandrium_andersonii.AAC.1
MGRDPRALPRLREKNLRNRRPCRLVAHGEVAPPPRPASLRTRRPQRRPCRARRCGRSPHSPGRPRGASEPTRGGS